MAAMSLDDTWMGRPLQDMTREELAAALTMAASLLRRAAKTVPVRPEIELSQTRAGTSVAGLFKWAFLPAGYLWSEDDRAAIQARLDAFAPAHGLRGPVVRFETDRLKVDIPHAVQAEQVMAIQDWLESERETLDVSQVP